MSCQVYANGDEIACKAGDGKVVAAFPDVCLTPPTPPAGPIPVPYANTSFSKDMKNGSKTVKIKGQEVMLKDLSFYKTAPLGNEAATKSQGAGVVTHVITGKTYFVAWSMDVKFEGENVDRHTDLTTSNHASPTANASVPMVNTASMAPSDSTQEPKCPCCGDPLHPNQKDENGQPYEPISEDAYYDKGVATMQAKLDSINKDVFDKKPYTLDPDKLKKVEEGTAKQLADAKAARDTVAKARDITPPCENLHQPKNEKCGTHFNATRSLRSLAPSHVADGKKKNYVRETVLGFTDTVKSTCRKIWRDKGRTVPKDSPVNHMTPLAAGGCPTSQKNLIPSGALPKECQEVDAAQTKLQEIGEKAW